VKGMIRIQRLAAPYRKKVKNIHYRRNVAREILKTEEFYVESLDVLLCVRSRTAHGQDPTPFPSYPRARTDILGAVDEAGCIEEGAAPPNHQPRVQFGGSYLLFAESRIIQQSQTYILL
jgi:hypothetical protein